MAVTITLYDHTAKRFANQEVSIANLKVMLLNDNAAALFDATDTTLDAVAGAAGPSRANEVSGNGWTEGGEALGSAAVTIVTTNDAKLDATDVSVTATGGPIGPAESAVIFDDNDADKAPLAFVDFGQAETAGEDTDFKIVWNTDGVITWTYT